MATLLRVPEVAAGATEAVLSEWLVKENEPFRAGDPIVVIETEKAVVEVEAEVDSMILRTLVSGGSEVEVGSPMALVGAESEKDADLDQILADLGVGTVVDKAAPPRREVPEPDPQPAVEFEEAAPVVEEAAPALNGGTPARIFISPIARKILKEAGLPVESLQGTGPNGRIVRRDVEKAVAAKVPDAAVEARSAPSAPARVAASTAGSAYTEIPHSRLRKAVANRLTQSKQTIPHFYVKRTALIDDLLAVRSQINAVAPHKVSVNDLVIRAVAAAHVEIPEANVIWTDEGMRQFDSVDISVAIASERGLVTPVLRSVEKTSVGAVAAAVKAYVQQANDGKLQQRDLEGGSISVTNLGMFGVEEFSAIINPPQSAILAVGAGRPEPVVVDGAVTVATRMALVLSVDHRAIDGALAARWMDALVRSIEEPFRLLA